MRGDFSIWREERRQNFNGVLHQQGRVLLDADWNAQTLITNDWEDTAARDVIGAGVAGVPADAPDSVKISAAAVAVGGLDLTVSPGRVWADGLLAYLDASADVHRLATYLEPPIAPLPGSAPGAAGTRDAIVLEVWREEITGFQMPDLLVEPALGGPDTTERVHTEMAFRLLRLTNPADTCDSIIERLRDNFSTKGRLTVELDAPPPPTGDCPVLAGSGYTGFEHNLYRIEIAQVNSGTAPMFKWSQFGGGLVGRGQLRNSAHTITLSANQQAIINSGLPKFYMEVVSYDSARGRWMVTYGANVTLGSNGTLTIPSTATGVFFGSPPGDGNIFFRLWNAIRLIGDFDGPASLTLQDGILLKFDPAAGANYVAGDYWTFPVRAGEITNITPLIHEQQPEGIHYHRVPLGIIEWTAAGRNIEDCRRIFQPLTRLATCCTYRVGNGMHSHGDFRSIQAAVNALPADGGEVCVLPGEYEENVVIRRRRDIKIHGCGWRTQVISHSGRPVFHIVESQNIQILSLAVEAHETGVGILLEGRPPDIGILLEGRPFDAIVIEQPAGGGAPLRNIRLEDLILRAARRSAIEAKFSNNVTIRRCRIEMRDVATGWPGVFFSGEDSLIEENFIVVANVERRIGEFDVINPLDGSFALPVLAARGGLQIGGGSERIRVINNVIARGIESGIILGSLQTITTGPGRPILAEMPRLVDESSRFRPGNTAVAATADIETRLSSEGDLYDIVIERNQIFNMGLNGITVAGFFELEQAREFITVHGLVIDGNVIRRCMRRPVEIETSMLDKVGYGGIALSHVEHLAIRDNFIEDNGPNQLEPICGIFVLHGEGIEISRNWILNNGAKPRDPSSENPSLQAKLGQRGGINIVSCIAPVVDVTVRDFANRVGTERLSTQNGMPALTVHDNIVSVPLGQALRVMALGAVSVIGNQFTSRGMVLALAAPSFFASTVMITNLGTSKEFLSQLMTPTTVTNVFVRSPCVPQRSPNVAPAAAEPASPAPLGASLVNGNVLFSNNQCSLDLLEQGISFALSSILIVSLDDVGFHNNQCDCNLLDDFVFTHTFLLGATIRVTDNRFKEGCGNALLSAITFGLLNITSDNESTHCLLVEGGKKLRRHNLVLLSLFNGEICQQLEGADDDDCERKRLTR